MNLDPLNGMLETSLTRDLYARHSIKIDLDQSTDTNCTGYVGVKSISLRHSFETVTLAYIYISRILGQAFTRVDHV